MIVSRAVIFLNLRGLQIIGKPTETSIDQEVEYGELPVGWIVPQPGDDMHGLFAGAARIVLRCK